MLFGACYKGDCLFFFCFFLRVGVMYMMLWLFVILVEANININMFFII